MKMKSVQMCTALAACVVVVAAQSVLAGDEPVSGAAGSCCGSGACAASLTKSDPSAAPAPSAEAVINTAGLKAIIQAKTPVAILDARTGKFDDGRRLPGAKALDPAASEAVVAAALPDKAALVVTYCAGLKCPASHILGEKLRGLGYSNVIEYHEGISGWVDAGNAVEQSK